MLKIWAHLFLNVYVQRKRPKTLFSLNALNQTKLEQRLRLPDKQPSQKTRSDFVKPFKFQLILRLLGQKILPFITYYCSFNRKVITLYSRSRNTVLVFYRKNH
jgi:hypothetical protein